MVLGKPGRRAVTLQFPEKEFERVTNAAASRGLNNSSFVMMVVVGAINRGGGTLDQLVEGGSRSIPMRKRHEKSYEHNWRRTASGSWVWGKWELYKTVLKKSKGRDNPNNWWQLRHRDYPDLPRPVAFLKEEAIREASTLITNGYHPIRSRPASADRGQPPHENPRSDRPA